MLRVRERHRPMDISQVNTIIEVRREQQVRPSSETHDIPGFCGTVRLTKVLIFFT